VHRHGRHRNAVGHHTVGPVTRRRTFNYARLEKELSTRLPPIRVRGSRAVAARAGGILHVARSRSRVRPDCAARAILIEHRIVGSARSITRNPYRRSVRRSDGFRGVEGIEWIAVKKRLSERSARRDVSTCGIAAVDMLRLAGRSAAGRSLTFASIRVGADGLVTIDEASAARRVRALRSVTARAIAMAGVASCAAGAAIGRGRELRFASVGVGPGRRAAAEAAGARGVQTFGPVAACTATVRRIADDTAAAAIGDRGGRSSGASLRSRRIG